MIDLDEALNEILSEEHFKITQQVIDDIIKEWDKGEGGYFPRFVLHNFASYWIEKVSRN